MTTLHDIDNIQLFISSPFVKRHAAVYLQYKNIAESYVTLYLSVQLFVKIPDMFNNISHELKDIIDLIYNNIDLENNLPKFRILFNEWKKTDANEIINEIEFMKGRTRTSSTETDDTNCKKCYEIQEDILSAAEKYFKLKFNQDI